MVTLPAAVVPFGDGVIIGMVVAGPGTNEDDALDGALVPAAFVAVTAHVYVSPFVKPDTAIGLPAPDIEPVAPPSDEVHVTA